MGSFIKTFKQTKKAIDSLTGSSKKKNQKRKAASSKPATEIDVSSGYVDVYRNGREWFSGEIVASNERYWLAYGSKGDTDALAFGDRSEVLATKKWEDTADEGIIHENCALVFGEDHMAMLSADSGFSRAFGYGMAADSERVLTGDFAAYIEEDDTGEAILLRCFAFGTMGSWKKKIKLPLDDEGCPICCNPSLSSGPEGLIVEIEGETYRFSVEGDSIEER